MKNILICLFVFFISSCEESKASYKRYNESIVIKDQHGVEYRVVVVEGCEFYYDGSGLAKVDCDCVPDKSNR